jgi:hypothetical protein
MADLDLPPVPDAAVAAAAAEMPALDPGVIRRCLLEPALPATVAAVLLWAAEQLRPTSQGYRREADRRSAASGVPDDPDGRRHARAVALAVGVEQARDRLRALAEEITEEEGKHG